MKKKNIFLTIFDSKYLDKGLALIHSLQRRARAPKVYVLALDELAGSILRELDLKGTIIFSESDITDPRLMEAKGNRSRASYAWTTKAFALWHVFSAYGEKICTYVDSDIFCFSDPQPFLDELDEGNYSVGLMPHAFNLSHPIYQKSQENGGKYCAGLVTFKNDEPGLTALLWWLEQVYQLCTDKKDGIHFADQKYLEKLAEDKEHVHVYVHPGAALGPWNLGNFRILNRDTGLYCKRKADGIIKPVILYHFQGMEYLENGHVNLHVMSRPDHSSGREVSALYLPYLEETEKLRAFLYQEYALEFPVKSKERQRQDAERYRKNRTLNPAELKRLMYRFWTRRYDFLDLSRLGK